MDKIAIYIAYILIASLFSLMAEKFDKKSNEHKITGGIRHFFLGFSNTDYDYFYWF